MKRILVASIGSAVLAGCGSLGPTVPINPPSLHSPSEESRKSLLSDAQKLQKTGAEKAEMTSIGRYYTRLEETVKDDSPVKRADYIEAGIGLVQTQCMRWFRQLSERNMVKDYSDANFNVIRSLGTALLGIGKANDIIVAAYGAANTAYEGVSKNYEDAFLLAPNSKKVRGQIMNLLDDQAKKLRESQPGNFDQAFTALERYAEICTHSTAREIVNDALDQSVATLTDDGKVRMVPTVEARQTALTVEERKKSEAALRDKVQKESQSTLKRLQETLADQNRQIEKLKQASPSAVPASAASK